MTEVPLPASPCVRVRMVYLNTDGFYAGSRFYLSYTGGPPTGANCITLAGDVQSQWSSLLAAGIGADWSITEVDVLDIATDSGFSGQWVGSEPGGSANPYCPAQCATNVEFGISRRYRGGKPRMFFPPPGAGDLETPGTWTSAFVTEFNTAVVSFFSAIEALSIGSMGTLKHVNLSYYKGFTNVVNSSGREKAVPTYRTAAVVDPVTGYATKVVVGSQKRRRTATTA